MSTIAEHGKITDYIKMFIPALSLDDKKIILTHLTELGHRTVKNGDGTRINMDHLSDKTILWLHAFIKNAVERVDLLNQIRYTEHSKV